MKQPSQAGWVKGEFNQLSTSCVSQTQSRATAESSHCLLDLGVDPSTSKVVGVECIDPEKSAVVFSIVQRSTNRADSLVSHCIWYSNLLVKLS